MIYDLFDTKLGLTTEQQVVFNSCMEFINDEMEANYFLLRGYAGTGKTFTIGKIITALKEKDVTKKVVMTAPTNKAVRVLKNSSADLVARGVEFMTIHKLLGLRPVIDARGRQTFESDFKVPSRISEFDILILDEVSMLDDNLFRKIHNYSQTVKIIYMGDPAQIPPVNNAECIPFTKSKQEEYKFYVSDLKTIIRQKEGNPIIKLSLNIRNNLHLEDSLPDDKADFVNEYGGYQFYNLRNPDTANIFGDLLSDNFLSKEFNNDPDYCKVIAWTNDTVNKFNSRIRQMKYGSNSKLNRIEVGEKLIADTPIFQGDKIIFNTNDEMEVNTFNVEKTRLGHWIYNCVVTYYDFEEEEYTTKRIKVLHENSYTQFNAELQQIANEAKALNKDRNYSKAKSKWVQFYLRKNSYAHVKYNYAITAHKAQGSTYKYVFLINSDINKNRKLIERNRIKYTACTRPSDKLFIVDF